MTTFDESKVKRAGEGTDNPGQFATQHKDASVATFPSVPPTSPAPPLADGEIELSVPTDQRLGQFAMEAEFHAAYFDEREVSDAAAATLAAGLGTAEGNRSLRQMSNGGRVRSSDVLFEISNSRLNESNPQRQRELDQLSTWVIRRVNDRGDVGEVSWDPAEWDAAGPPPF